MPWKGGKIGGLPLRQGQRRQRLTAAAIAGITIAGALTALMVKAGPPDAVTANSGCQKVVVPAYFYPGSDWIRADNSRPAPGIMILDITGTGAGNSPDRKYQEAASRAQAAGIEVMGYSATDYAKRPAAAIEADVRHYRAWYHVTDIFLDQAASSDSQLAYYRELSDYIHAVNPGSMVMLNPGTYPDRQYMSVGDVLMVYEDSYADFVSLRVPDWVRDYPAGRFAFVIYATPGSRLAGAISLSRERHAGYIYVTDGSGPDPYGSLPSYWSGEDAIIAAQCPA